MAMTNGGKPSTMGKQECLELQSKKSIDVMEKTLNQ